jgi:transcriptional regulator with XRE-family HTH domain
MRLVKEIADAIKDYRYHNNLTQVQFGRLVGIKQSQVARWENMEVKSLSDDTWERIYPIVESYLPPEIRNKSFTIFESSAPYNYNQSYSPLPVILQTGKAFNNYQKREQDKVFGYTSSDMEPIIPADSNLLVDMLKEAIQIPTKVFSLTDLRVRLPHNELVVLKWANEDEFRVRRIFYKAENEKDYQMYLTPGKTDSKKALKINKQEKLTFYGFVRGIINTKVPTTGFID